MDDDELGRLVSGYDAAKRHAMQDVEVIREFHETYPESQGFFTHYSGEVGPTSWSSITWLYGRYELTLTLPVELSSDRRRVIGARDPFFTLVEVVHIDELGRGRFSVHSGHGWQFGRDMWDELKRANGRIEDVVTEPPPGPASGEAIDADQQPFEGIRVDEPVPFFDVYVERMKLMAKRPE